MSAPDNTPAGLEVEIPPRLAEITRDYLRWQGFVRAVTEGRDSKPDVTLSQM